MITDDRLKEIALSIGAMPCTPNYMHISESQLRDFINTVNAEECEPVAQAYINYDGECEQIDWLGTINPVVDNEFTPLFTSPQIAPDAEYIKRLEDSLKMYAQFSDGRISETAKLALASRPDKLG